MGKFLIEVKNPLAEIVDIVHRVPQKRSGYQVVKYNGHYYRLAGGIRTNHFITLGKTDKK